MRERVSLRPIVKYSENHALAVEFEVETMKSSQM